MKINFGLKNASLTFANICQIREFFEYFFREMFPDKVDQHEAVSIDFLRVYLNE